MNSITNYTERARLAFSAENQSSLDLLNKASAGHISTLVDHFYATLLALPEASRYLDHELIDARLRTHQERWLGGLFRCRDAEQIEAFVTEQIKTGSVHARINVPMYLVTEGFRVYMERISALLDLSSLVAQEVLLASRHLHEIFDLVQGLITESYLNDLLANERDTQDLRAHTSAQVTAIECERLRASLYLWLGNLTLQVYHNPQEIDPGQHSLKDHEIWLWLLYKVEFAAQSNPVLPVLRAEIEAVDGLTEELDDTARYDDGDKLNRLLTAINRRVEKIGWHLSGLSESILQTEQNTDPLTRLLNRRHLASVMRRQIETSERYGVPFSILIFDLDHFKSINDRYGHATGDRVIVAFCRKLIDSTRSVDFLFRYGGEEFLAILGNSESNAAGMVAEKIRAAVSASPLMGEEQNPEGVQYTVSAGVAQYDGHPDFTALLKRADVALYRAKSNGRNRVELSMGDA